SPRHHLCHGRAFPGDQKPVLLFEALQAARRYVVLAWGRGFVTWRFSREPFSHILVSPLRLGLTNGFARSDHPLERHHSFRARASGYFPVPVSRAHRRRTLPSS